MTVLRGVWTVAMSVLVTACGPTEQQKAKLAEKKQIECLDKFCQGDVEPEHDRLREEAIKLNGQWFVGPKEYFSSGSNGAVFYWPSRSPGFRGGDYPERGKSFYDFAIEIFLRSNNIPAEPYGYQFIRLAESNGWIASRRTIRRGLDKVEMKHVIGPRGYYVDHVTYYVATELTGSDGLPPVATCSHEDPRNGGGGGFMWKSGIWAGIRMNQKYCSDWPEIYREVSRVLQLLKGA